MDIIYLLSNAIGSVTADKIGYMDIVGFGHLSDQIGQLDIFFIP
jgi:hypothetical protein